MKTLYITEKPSQIIALNKVLPKKDIEIKSLAGHIMRQYNPEEYSKELKDYWPNLYKKKKIPYHPDVYKKKIKENVYYVKNGKKLTSDYKKKFTEIKNAINSCDQIIIASDPDNEGVVLAMEVIEACNAVNKVVGMVNMAKLDPNSLAKEVQIINKIPYKLMNEAGNLRANFDWDFGMNLTMIATVLLGQGKTLHMGGVKLPTIRMVVERDLAFEQHKEIPFWEVKVLAKDEKSGKTFPMTVKLNSESKFDQESVAKDIESRLKNGSFKVSSYQEINKTSQPPLPYSLTDIQSEASRKYKYSAAVIGQICQKLYEKGIQSYPRTEENYYSNGQYTEVSNTIKHLQKNFSVTPIKPYKKRRIFDDKKLDGKAHTALCPTMQGIDVNKLNTDERNIYLMVASRYFIQFLEDYRYLNIQIKSINSDLELVANENVEQSKGWKEVFNTKDDSVVSSRTFPVMSKNDKITIVDVTLKKSFTKPKPQFTEATLMKGMERIATLYDDPQVKLHLKENGIGTPATRSGILEELFATKKNGKPVEPYLKKERGKILSTPKARELIHILPDHITSPVLRAELESRIKDIVSKKETKSDLGKKIVNEIDQMVKELEETALKFNISIAGGISDKMLNYAKTIAQNLKITIPKDIISDKDKLSEWIDINSKNVLFKPSEKMINYAKSISEQTKIKLSENLFDDTKELSKWIDTNSKKIPKKKYKLSEGQIKVLKNPKNKLSKTIEKLLEKDELEYSEYVVVKKKLDSIFKSFRK